MALSSILKRTASDTLATVAWPKGPLLLGAAFLIILVMDVSNASGEGDVLQMLGALAGKAAAIAAILACGAFAWSILTLTFRHGQEGTAAEIRTPPQELAPFDAEQLKRVLARYYESAHTFVYFWPAAGVSLTQNIRSIRIHSPREVSLYFLQPMERETIIVRPVSGTPKIEIVSCDNRHVRIRANLWSEAVKLRIFGSVIPTIRNHPEPRFPQAASMKRKSAVWFGAEDVVLESRNVIASEKLNAQGPVPSGTSR